MGSPTFMLRAGVQGRWQDRSSSWSVERLNHHQSLRLAALRQHAVAASPFYREAHRGLEHAPLAALPVLTKATLMAQFDRIVTDPDLRLADLEAHLVGPVSGGGQRAWGSVSGARPPEATDSPLGGQRAQRAWGSVSGARPSEATDSPLGGQRAQRAWGSVPGGAFRGRYTVMSTSGSTGLRGVFVFDPAEWLRACGAITRPLLWAKAPPPWTRPRSAIIASCASWHYSARIGQAFASRWLPSLRLDAAAPLQELTERLNAWQPDALAVYPSVLLQLAEEQLAGRLRIRPRHIGTSAERLCEATRARVRAAWSIPVFDTYGATEYAPIATECLHGSLHLLEDRALIEVVDDRGRAVPDGELGSRLLLTVLDRRTQPLIRYELSDGVRVQPGRCACGRPFRRLAAIEGRVEEILTLPAAKPGLAPVSLHPNVFHDLLEAVPATAWQVRHEASGALRVLLTGRPRADAAAALRHRLLEGLARRGAACPALDVRWVDALPRGASGKAALIVRG